MSAGETIWNNLLDQIEQRGWAWQHVHPDDGSEGGGPFPHYCYTIGLSKKGVPDLIIIGLAPETAVAVGNRLIMKALANVAGTQAPPFEMNTDLLEVFNGTRAMLVDVPYEHAANRAFFALDYAEAVSKPLKAIQLLWPDRQGRFPFEDGATPSFAAAQPVLKNLPPPAPEHGEAPLLQ